MTELKGTLREQRGRAPLAGIRRLSKGKAAGFSCPQADSTCPSPRLGQCWSTVPQVPGSEPTGLSLREGGLSVRARARRPTSPKGRPELDQKVSALSPGSPLPVPALGSRYKAEAPPHVLSGSVPDSISTWAWFRQLQISR